MLELTAEDFLSESLQTLYDYQPITVTMAGAPFKYTLKTPTDPQSEPLTISLRTPDTDGANWALHASSIWISSIYLADHLEDLHIPSHMQTQAPGNPVRVLELGASAGLPSILISKLYPALSVTATDYPDVGLIKTLAENVQQNGVAQRCRALPFAWGSDPSPILEHGQKFDLVIATDTLWNPDLHVTFIHTLESTLRKSPLSRVHLVVGLHTGRYTIQSFLKQVLEFGFDVEGVVEREIAGSSVRAWDVSRENGDEREKRRWIIWIQLKWTRESL
ncbi:hypothetical protein M413DRAFT_442646 [Hebeloma cylindrosporum]|uniref:Methyltransferase small domain-containing protein n=1 Tax=Hebeloma cylindrosporum TaxID=76867 RepID=A0A0C2Y4C4_HEBCY|nr:hypothetical protein M413DRAFT_442646 [Hebeloma cylindrosporum h7]